MTVRRMGMVIAVRPERVAEYKALHANPWPEMGAALSAANIANYSIYLRENLLFGYWEYAGSDFAADMKVLRERDVTKHWLALTDPCQTPLPSAAPDEWWSDVSEIFHLD